MSQETAEVLKKAKALIDTPEKWTTEQYARGPFVHVPIATRMIPDDATCFCAIGALAKVLERTPRRVEDHPAHDALRSAMCASHVPDWNDNATHADVMAAFDRAIATESTTTAAGAE